MPETQNVTSQELKAGLAIAHAVLETVRESGELGAPEGPMYAALVGRVDIHGWQSLVRMLVRTGLVEQKGNVLYWKGPEGK